MKQLQDDPWMSVEDKFPIDSMHMGKITNITDYGAFVSLDKGVEGLVHVSEMSWTKKNLHPGKIVSISEEVKVVILEIDTTKRRVSLGLKQAQNNPWEEFNEKYPSGSQIEGIVKNTTEFGLFIGLENDIDGMVHLSDLDWNRSGEEALADYSKGDTITAVVTDVNIEKERVSLSVKALSEDPFTEATSGVKRGAVVSVVVTKIEDGGIEVEYEGMKAYIRRSDLSRDRDEQRPERFVVGDKVDARITAIDSKTRKLSLSVKAREIAEEKEAVEQYGSSDSGSVLGDILGVALKSAASDKEAASDKPAKKAPAKKAPAKTPAKAKAEPKAKADKAEPEAKAEDATEAKAEVKKPAKAAAKPKAKAAPKAKADKADKDADKDTDKDADKDSGKEAKD